MPELKISGSNAFALKKKGDQSFAKFILYSKDSFQIAVKSVIGQVRVSISLDPDNIMGNAIWSLTLNGLGGVINVPADDPNFQLGTFYYIAVEQQSDRASSGKLDLNQVLYIEYLANGVESKLQFSYDLEIVKLALFAIPYTWSVHSKTLIEFEPLSDHVYPSIYLKKIDFSKMPDNLVNVVFPTLNDYDLSFG